MLGILGMAREWCERMAGLEPEQALVEWYQGDIGRHVWSRLHEEMPSLLGEMFGYVGVQIGLGALSPSLLASSRVKQQAGMATMLSGADVLGRPEALPFAAETLDLVVLPHVLEFSPDPHQVLREIDRVLVPEGHAVFIGFNPISLWGLWALAGGGPRQFSKRSGRAHLYTQARLKDWLALLGFDISQTRHLMYRPPSRRALMTDRCGWLETMGRRRFSMLGGIRIIAAKKRESTLTFIKPSRRRLRVLPGAAIKTTPKVISSERHD